MYRTLVAESATRFNTSQPTAEAAAILLFQGEVPEEKGLVALLGAHGAAAVRAILARPEWSGEAGGLSTIYPPQTDTGTGDDASPQRVFLVGLGKRRRLTGHRRGDAIRNAGAALVKAAASAKVRTVRVALAFGTDADDARGTLEPEAFGEALADGMSAAMLKFEQYQGEAKRSDNTSEAADAADTAESDDGGELRVWLEDDAAVGFERGMLIGGCVATARTLAATPPNVANPAYLIAQCRDIAERAGLTIRVIDAGEAAEHGMGGLLAVGRAGSTPPALIVLEWPGSGAEGDPPVLLVGKAVTFDTGGYSLKTATGMSGMKYDKCGGTAIIGAMEAAARLEVARRVIGLIPTAENMIASEAYRVDDILRFCNGVTGEITNTDAEGRLILADALAYGTREYRPAAVIDLATLTGGVITALGDTAAGMFCNDDSLRGLIEHAADHAGERVWRLPLWDEHRDQMRGTHADLVNSADRKAHPIQGAAFLSFFVGEDAPQEMPVTPWCHLDIAGVATVDKDTPLYKKGPTGWGVRLLAEYLRRM